jgi:hypothetical protein
MRTLAAILLTVATTMGCTAKLGGGEVEVKSRPVTVTVGESGPGRFCPPGHAKQGRC